MQHLSSAWPTIDSLPSTSSAEDVSLERLAQLSETSLIQAQRDEAAANLARLGGAAAGTRTKAEALVAGFDLKLTLAKRRDAVRASRPEHCWCLGLGGGGFRYIPALDDGDAVQVLETYCVCPEAVTRRAQDDVERAHYQRHRTEHRLRQYFQAADVPTRFERCSFETYPESGATADVVARVRGWASGEARERDSLLLYGLYGTGKTGLAVSAMRVWIGAEAEAALFITVPDLLDRIRATYNAPRQRESDEPSERDVLRAVREVGLLVLDDLGAERPTDWVQEKLFAIINARHDHHRATIFTSNLDPAALAAHLGERTAWRIVEMCEVIHLEGPNLRDRSE